MTRKEIERAKIKARENNPLEPGTPGFEFSKEQEELFCREMINSCLCYDTDFLNSQYKDRYVEELGEERVKELYEEQKEDFAKARVERNVFTDNEGLSYDHIVWADEM